jgi:hypothetical protein
MTPQIDYYTFSVCLFMAAPVIFHAMIDAYYSYDSVLDLRSWRHRPPFGPPPQQMVDG